MTDTGARRIMYALFEPRSIALPYFTTSAFSNPLAANASRTAPASTGLEKSTTISVPPRNSTPQFNMCPRLLMT